MSEKIRVLQINSGSINFGGVSSFLYNIYCNIDKKRVQFDFLSPDITTYGIYRKEIENYGGKIYDLHITGNIVTRKIKLYFGIKKFLRKHDYKIVHVNSGNFFFNLFVLFAINGKKMNRKVIVHSHNAGDLSESKIKHLAMNELKPLLEKKADFYFACSEAAAEYMFTKKTLHSKMEVIHNGIDVDKFKYNPIIRQRVRAELKLENAFIIGMVARFEPQKNHKFALELFSKVVKKNRNAYLMLVGQGKLEKTIRDLAKRLDIEKHVLFMGVQKNVEQLYQAMDVFLLPSHYEGFGIVNIEAQTAGLKCVVSDAIPEEVDVTGRVTRLSLKTSDEKWVECILEEVMPRRDYSGVVKEKGYDVTTVSNKLEKFYERIM